MESIFDRIRLTPPQMRTVADRRFDDAEYLRKSKLNKHANGVFYIGGFVLECLLKAKLLDKHPELQKPVGRDQWTDEQRHRFDLIYRWHDLAAILEAMPEILDHLLKVEPSGQLRDWLVGLCEQWNVFARYSPPTAKMKDASIFLDRIKELKAWLT